MLIYVKRGKKLHGVCFDIFSKQNIRNIETRKRKIERIFNREYIWSFRSRISGILELFWITQDERLWLHFRIKNLEVNEAVRKDRYFKLNLSLRDLRDLFTNNGTNTRQ